MQPTRKTKTFRKSRAQDGRKALDAYRNVIGIEDGAGREGSLAKISVLVNLAGVLDQLLTHEMGVKPKPVEVEAREAMHGAYAALYRLMREMQQEVSS